ncbi:MAG: response regulator [Candidatus Cloacimonetes bacterium]|nr:response regulator [Candidatus Cloacimonadota bacterium]MCF7814934.1 response regulator [Candidatus Cloacimonadota bacterium]MCF7868140.1 response regulator [Candidatus Cloacimonadota bacterium]MCF7883606.1 response regulator [Candidatus Cloacimonadota bacterium]
MYRIMIVEDEVMISEDIKKTLIQMEYDVVGVCASGEDAISLAINEKPDLIIMDIMLEGKISGIEAAKRIQKQKDIPVIFLTAYADDKTIQTATEAEPYFYLVKPFNENDLKAAIQITFVKNEASKKLKVSNTKFTSLFLGNPEPAAYVDLKYRVIEINIRFTEVFGYKQNEAKDKLIFDLIVPDDKRREAKELSQGKMKKVMNFETVRKDKNENLIPVLVSTSPIIIDEKPTGMIITYRDISKLKKAEKEKEKLIQDLQKALHEVKTLSGLIPICSHCKKVRDDGGYWDQVENYIARHANVDFSHGICPDCMRQYYPEMYDKMKKKGEVK